MPALGGEWPQTADSNRLTVDLGDVESRARLQQAIEVEEEIALALELEVDSIVGEDACANPFLKLAGQKYNGAKLVGSPNRSKAYDRTSHHRRWYSEPLTCSDADAVSHQASSSSLVRWTHRVPPRASKAERDGRRGACSLRNLS
jgi:hypothetical protein